MMDKSQCVLEIMRSRTSAGISALPRRALFAQLYIAGNARAAALGSS